MQLLSVEIFGLDTARQHRWFSLVYASEELRGDFEVVLEAVKRDGRALEHASDKLRGDRDLVIAAVRTSCDVLQYASEEFCGDREVILEAVRLDDNALSFATAELRGDKEFVLEAVRRNGFVLLDASAELRSDKEVVLEAVRQQPEAWQWASVELQGDPSLQFDVVERNVIAVQGSAAPICIVFVLSLLETKKIFYRATVGLRGSEISGEVSLNASLGDLAVELRVAARSELVYLLLPGSDIPVSPFLAQSPLIEFIQ